MPALPWEGELPRPPPPPPPHIIYPLVMAFNVQENAVFIPELSKISLPWEGPPGWASSYNRVARLYIIPTKILSISMTVDMLGKFYQYKDNKGTNWPLYGNMQIMLSLGEGAFQCILSIALVIKQ